MELANRLVQIYKEDSPDVVTVVLEADGFADLLERTEFLQRTSAQDARIINRVRDAKVRALISQEVDTVNARLASFEKIVAWELLPNEFTLETGELTPTQKVKRRVINQKYGDVIDRLYAEAEKYGG